VATWKKLLARMLTDSSPTAYTYGEASSVLRHLNFALAPSGGGSHRKWRRKLPDGTVIVIGLIEKGTGALKAYLIRDMVRQLINYGLVPPDLAQE
jgi:hypothetical protein